MGQVVQHDGFDPGEKQHLGPFGRRPRHGKVKMLPRADGARVNFESYLYQRSGIRMPWSVSPSCENLPFFSLSDRQSAKRHQTQDSNAEMRLGHDGIDGRGTEPRAMQPVLAPVDFYRASNCNKGRANASSIRGWSTRRLSQACM